MAMAAAMLRVFALLAAVPMVAFHVIGDGEAGDWALPS